MRLACRKSKRRKRGSFPARLELAETLRDVVLCVSWVGRRCVCVSRRRNQTRSRCELARHAPAGLARRLGFFPTGIAPPPGPARLEARGQVRLQEEAASRCRSFETLQALLKTARCAPTKLMAASSEKSRWLSADANKPPKTIYAYFQLLDCHPWTPLDVLKRTLVGPVGLEPTTRPL